MSEDFKELTRKEILKKLDSSNEDEKKEKHINIHSETHT